jgi:hypothetical protein
LQCGLVDNGVNDSFSRTLVPTNGSWSITTGLQGIPNAAAFTHTNAVQGTINIHCGNNNSQITYMAIAICRGPGTDNYTRIICEIPFPFSPKTEVRSTDETAAEAPPGPGRYLYKQVEF